MKSNEAPKKIYILSHKDYSDMRIFNAFTEKESNADVEYTRTDAFIEKAIKYIANHFLAPGMDNEIEDFVNYMEGVII